MKAKAPRISSFKLSGGTLLAGKYEVVLRLGSGWEGEVYLVRECGTRIERTVKIFFPRRNLGNRALRFYARKLHKLRHCPIVIQYHTRDTFVFDGLPVSFLVSEFVEGELLSDFLKRQSGRRLNSFQAVHLLHALAAGIELIHNVGEYHGDLHTDNVIVLRYGLGFELKLLDMFSWGSPNAENIQHDVFDLIRIFYDALGGQRWYRRQPQEVKDICKGLKRSLIAREFRSAGQLCQHLEMMEWQ
ncbi:MAG: protein kinase [Acidiferrobacteraceae bacterium]|jgi:tRNA A-37 threonylcarbamoyl transferase component Bud32|nr:protein kinase [Acidiferrobacteraceae bacterium]MBT3638933.1 protein kinase [Acidiferrobacteraceae bacterium]MBT5980568.1 protein kinase [Acidiferrobacteraceae bacterium]MBT6732963.1 protein kinase [Acidiferrobacteraceae bacterium]MBT6786422.1 protein kinase [Acidiferrobacteraceae bacterium]